MFDVLLLVVAALGLFGELGLLGLLVVKEATNGESDDRSEGDVLLDDIAVQTVPRRTVGLRHVDGALGHLRASTGTSSQSVLGHGRMVAHGGLLTTYAASGILLDASIRKAEEEALGKPSPADEETEVSSMSDSTFTLTAEHIKLLRAAYVGWEDCETGAPAIDCKRPYGNSYVPGDIAEILGWHLDDGGHVRDESRERAMELHRETQTALQVVLATGSFEPGLYVMERKYDDRSWRRV